MDMDRLEKFPLDGQEARKKPVRFSEVPEPEDLDSPQLEKSAARGDRQGDGPRARARRATTSST